jgi:uncharacterized protein YecT (DUF1311 family)
MEIGTSEAPRGTGLLIAGSSCGRVFCWNCVRSIDALKAIIDSTDLPDGVRREFSPTGCAGLKNMSAAARRCGGFERAHFLVIIMKLAFLLLTSLVVSSFCPAHALDCKNASLQVEKLICATPELKKTDETMSAAYFELLRKTPDPEFHEALIRSQRRWIQARSRGVPRIDGEDAEPDDRKVLLKITADRLKFLNGPEPVRTMEQQRKIASEDGGGPFEGYETESCEFLPPHYGDWGYSCWTTTHRQHKDRICSVTEDWASGHTTEHRLVSIVSNGDLKPVASCYTGYAGMTCPDPEAIEEVGDAAHWNTNPQSSTFDLHPPRAGSLWKYDPDGPSGDNDPWMHDCLFAPIYPPANVSRPDPVSAK